MQYFRTSYHTSFRFHSNGNTVTDTGTKTAFSNLYSTKKSSRYYNFSNGTKYIIVQWFEPRRYRTGMERIHCFIEYGTVNCDSHSIIDYCGGCNLDKFNGSFYSCLYKMGLDLYKDGYRTTAHYDPLDVLPALARHLFNISDLSNWTIFKHFS